MKEEIIGKVKLNYSWYSGEDLYSDGDAVENRDGDAVENRILDIVRNEEGYEFALDEYTSWPILYHLTRQRENIVLPMEIGKTDEVLEVGAGMGAVTGALARKAKKVDCIELSRRRSLVNAERHKDLDNIEIFVGNFRDIRIEKKYDAVVLIGVLEYAVYYVGGENPYETFLKKIAECLKPGGKLYVAIENKLGMKYFAGFHEDHLGKPFVGIEGYKKGDHVRTFTRSELSELASRCGFEDLYYFYPFPDYKLPTVILSDDNIRDAEIDFDEDSNYDLDILKLFSQRKAFAGLKGTDERAIFANSFLLKAVRKG